MKNLLHLLVLCLLSFSSYTQESITTELKKAYEEGKYDLIIDKHSEKVSEYPAKAIYYVAMAYYMKANDEEVLKLMDLSIKKDKTDPDAYFIKGMTYNYMGQFDNAIESLEKAIKIDATNSNYYSSLGDAYFNQKKYEKALAAYIEATEKDHPIDRPFTMIPQIYTQLNEPEKALAAFYKSKEVISKESDSYIITLYNIGLSELLNKNYDKAESALIELIELIPDDYNAYAKLIQVYYGEKEYSKAEPLKEKLYEAYDKNLLKGNLKKRFCFDQFDWKNYLIFAYEQFEEKEGELYYKHVFYVTNQKGETECTIQTENSPVSVELGGPKYAIGMDKNGTHSTFGFIDEDFKYDDLKSIVKKIVEEKISPTASSTVKTSK